MEITVNGRQHEVQEGTTVAELLRRLNVNTRYVAVEKNLDIVPRAEHDAHRLQDGDTLEIVTLVGGG